MLERFRAFFTAILSPIANLLLKLGVSPDAVTLVGTIGVCAGALVFFPQGELLIGVLVITVVASLTSKKGRAKTAVGNAKRHARDYMDLGYTQDEAERERIYGLLVKEIEQIRAQGEKGKALARDDDKLMELFEAAKKRHTETVGEESASRL